MTQYNFDSYCGLYCGACDIHLAYKTGYKSRLASFWSVPLLKTFLGGLGAPYDENDLSEMKCHGCKSDTLFVNCKACGIRTCAIEKKAEHCIDCREYPCTQFQERNKVEGLLPHIKLSRNNLERIKKAGSKQWLADQEKQWQCPKCKAGYAWYSGRCTKCGADLRARTFKFTFLQALFLELGIRLLAVRKKKQQ